MIAWFAKNDVAANLLLLVILALGLSSLYLSIPLEVFPSVEPRSVKVSIAIPGAMPGDVETSVSIKLEESVQDLEGIEDIISTASEGSSVTVITLDDSYDPQTLLSEIKNRIDAVNNLPSDAERPVVSLSKHRREVISVAVSGDLSEWEIRQQAQQVRDKLLAIQGISQVELDGVRDFEISIELDEQVLQKYGLSLARVATAIQQQSRDISAGSLKGNRGEILIRSSGQAYSKLEFEQIPVLSQVDGSVIRVGDLATVSDGFEESEIITRFNGRPAALVDVYRVGQESAIEVANKVKAYLEEVEASLPEGVRLDAWRDRSKIVKKRLKTLSDNAVQGGILVLLLLTLFLRPAIAFWVCIGIPVSFMGALLVMPFFGLTINIISLYGFIVILGIVVDDAIVTGENIYSHLRRSESGLEAAINGTKEVAVPVTFGILTTVAAFLPIAFIEGVRGQLFAAIPVVVIPILIFSLIESKFILPAHLKNLSLRADKSPSSLAKSLSRFQERFADGFESVVLRYYKPALTVVLNYRYLCLALSFGLLIILYGLVSSGWMKFVFFPKVQSELARANLEMPIGTPVDVTDRYIVEMLESARKLQDKYRGEQGDELIQNIMATTGSAGGASHTGKVIFEITSPEERALDISSRELVKEWRELIGYIPGAEKLTYRAEIGRVSDPIDISLSAQDFNELAKVAELIKGKLASYPGIFDISDSYSDGKEAVEINILPQASVLGLTRQEIMSQVREAFYGYEVQRIQRGRDDIKVVVRYPKSDRQSIRSLEEFLIRNAQGRAVPLSQVASLEAESTPAVISRLNLKRTISVRADVDKQATNMLVLQQELRAFIDQQLNQFPSVSYTMEGEAKEQRQSFGSLKWGILFVLFIIYSLLAIPFKSYLQPIVVMAVIPFGAIGAVGGHWLMGMDLTLVSLLGMLALTGIVVNDSLVLVDFVNKKRAEGQDLLATVSGAAAARFRPVILTSLTTFCGLMPLLFEESTQAQFLIPMAVSLGFGIVFATVITLVLVPVNYLVIEDINKIFKK